jgi:D-lyxose ketol-isomerase
MSTSSQYASCAELAASILSSCTIPLTARELSEIVVADFGLGNVLVEGAQILTLFDTGRISGKLIVLLPHQVLPEHWHPPVGDDPGKEEVLRALGGSIRCYSGIENASIPCADIPPGKESCYTCRQRVDLNAATQLVIAPGHKHWLAGGPEGGVVFSFSTCVRDVLDRFTDTTIVRTTVVVEG